MLTDKKIKEWYQWGKDGYKGNRNMVKNNSHHPDYDTKEKVEAYFDRYGDSYLLSDKRRELLKTKWEYSDEDIEKAFSAFKKGYDGSREWYKKNDAKFQAIIDKYTLLIKKAEEYAKTIDVSDIQDGFPCGSAHLYVGQYAEMEELRRALAHFQDASTEAYKYALPIKFPSYGQCISFDERICQKVQEFLRKNGLLVHTYSWID